MEDPGHTLTRLLKETAEGKAGALDELVALVYDELLTIAEQRLSQERRGHTLQATDLVHQAYLRLAGDLRGGPFENRAHFFHAAAAAMRRVLIEHARRRARLKRGGGSKRASISVADLAAPDDPDDVLALEEAIRRLEDWDPRLGEVVRLRFFAGLSVDETAGVLDVSQRTVKRDWNFAKAWLYQALRDDDAPTS